MSSDEALLRASGLTIAFSDREGREHTPLQNVSLNVHRGDFICLLGPSGSGKTTLLKALGGFIPPALGAIIFHGRELTSPSPEIVMIFQENNLYPWLNVEQNIAFGPRMRGLGTAEILQITQSLLETTGMTAARKRYPHELSGGMRQRVAIARAMAANSKVLLLDEPFSALDVSLRRKMQQFLRQIWQASHTTMILVTHSIEEAVLLGERVLVLSPQRRGVIEDLSTNSPALKDRYSPEFLALQRHLENLIGDDDEMVSPPLSRSLEHTATQP